MFGSAKKRALCAVLAFAHVLLVPAAAFATSIAVAYVDPVTGWEWAQAAETVGFSWNEVQGVCATDGVTACNADLEAVGFTGWVWATRDQVRDLFVNATDLTASELADYSEEQYGSTWAPQFLSLFTPTVGGFVVNGWSATTSSVLSGPAFTPLVVDHPTAGPRDSADLVSFASKADASNVRGVWLHRAVAPVPDGSDSRGLLIAALAVLIVMSQLRSALRHLFLTLRRPSGSWRWASARSVSRDIASRSWCAPATERTLQ